jgi:hypothetical protein
MCRSIVILHRADEPPTPEEVKAAALQYVRKISGYRTPSAANTAAFDSAVDEIAVATGRLLAALQPRRANPRPATRSPEEIAARRAAHGR